MQLRLAQKVLILIGIPVLFQLAFVFMLGFLLWQAEYEIWRERHSKNVIAESHALVNNLMGAVASLYLSKNTGNHIYHERFVVQTERIKEQLQTLKSLLRDSVDQRASLAQIDALSEKAIKMFTKGEAISSEGKSSASQVELGVLSQELIGDFKAFAKAQEQLESVDPERQSRIRSLILQVVVGGIIGNIILVAITAVLIHKTATKKLTVLVDNTNRIVRHMPLNKRLDGSDELAQLDQVFHQMADALNEAAQRKQEMISLVSHDLRSPLSCVKTSLEMVSGGDYGEIPQGALSELDEAEQNLTRLLGLVNDLLDIEKLEAGMMDIAPATESLDGIIEAAFLSVGNIAEKAGIGLELTGKEDLFVYADADRIVQVLVNLLSNALKFSVAGAKITVDVNSQTNELVVVSIIDSGRGIPAENKDLIFQRFQQVSAADGKRGKGTGLGLPICKAIVEGHQGTIGVESEPGKGSRFWFTLRKSELAPPLTA